MDRLLNNKTIWKINFSLEDLDYQPQVKTTSFSDMFEFKLIQSSLIGDFRSLLFRFIESMETKLNEAMMTSSSVIILKSNQNPLGAIFANFVAEAAASETGEGIVNFQVLLADREAFGDDITTNNNSITEDKNNNKIHETKTDKNHFVSKYR